MLLHFVLNMACGKMFSQKTSKFLEKKINFILLHLNIPCYYCSINFKRQSEHSGLRPDTSSLVSFCILHSVWGIVFKGKSKKKSFFDSFTNQSKHYCKDLKSWSQQSSLCPDTSSLACSF